MDALEDFEVSLLLSAIEHRFGYDFREYARASIKRRVRNAMSRHGIRHVSELIPRVLHEAAFFQDIVRDFSITVTEMFRDPQVWRTLREEVLPRLSTWSYFKIWHAACATGEEVYSMAILLQEAGLLDRATIYATDFNDTALQYARIGSYPQKDFHKASHNYLEAGGKRSLDAYCRTEGDRIFMNEALQKRIVWANHNLTIDNAFGEMNLIVCRNVLIYFTQPLQNRVLELFTESLASGGTLCLGNKESLDFSSISNHYDAISKQNRIYRYVRDFIPVSSPVANSGVLAIGGSLGGLVALQAILCALPADFPLPVLITLHVGPASESALAQVLQHDCALQVVEAIAGESIQAGTVYLAPADYHLLLCDSGTLLLSGDERDHYARPSINVMFESTAEVYGQRAIGVLLTGSNDDGARGMAAFKAAGSYTIVQDPLDAFSPCMPASALKLIQPDCILPLSGIAGAILIHSRIIAASHGQP
jgi:chemotaxis protein methyltransferase CheR